MLPLFPSRYCFVFLHGFSTDIFFLAVQYGRDFYIGQWLYDAHTELDRALKENPASPTAILNSKAFDEDGADHNDGVSSSGLALQQSEMKKNTILSFLDSKKQSSFKQLEGILDERLSAVVTRYLASSRALTRSFDMYLQKVSAGIISLLGRR